MGDRVKLERAGAVVVRIGLKLAYGRKAQGGEGKMWTGGVYVTPRSVCCEADPEKMIIRRISLPVS